MVPTALPGLVNSSLTLAVGIAESLTPSAAEVSFAKPKSRIFARPRFVTKIFAGLMSRWTMPFSCAASRASAISAPSSNTCSMGSGLPSIIGFEGLPLHELHGDERTPAIFRDFVDRADVRMVQCGSSTRFATQALQRLQISSPCLQEGTSVRRDGRGLGPRLRRPLPFLRHRVSPERGNARLFAR